MVGKDRYHGDSLQQVRLAHVALYHPASSQMTLNGPIGLKPSAALQISFWVCLALVGSLFLPVK